jgi:mono/diheme cytochrome c family protein
MQFRTVIRKSYGGAVAALVIAISASWAARPIAEPLKADTEDGRALFIAHCASCHGRSGRGDGPAAETLRVRPVDLTQLAKRSGGVFVDESVLRIIDGRGVKAHGNIEMPVWGDVFKRRQGLDDEAVKARIEAIVRYLRSIQEQSG